MAIKTVGNEQRIVLAEPQHDATIHWYHHILGHSGQECLVKSIQNHLHFPGLDPKVKLFVATSLLEIYRLDHLDAESTVMHFENCWLSRYPRPVRCIYDAASAFTAPPFQLALNRNEILAVPITAKNP